MRAMFLSAVLGVASISCSAQALDHETLVRRIVAAYSPAAVFTADSPMLDMLLASARSANTNVPLETWAILKAEVAEAVTAASRVDGGPADAIRVAVAPMSDAELQRLVFLLEDPMYAKFQLAMASPRAQSAQLRASARLGMLLSSAVHGVLAKHNLKEVH
jgi:hypothetical protein